MKFNLTPKTKTYFLKKSGKIVCRSTSSGITLIEVLIAAGLGIFVISGAAFGLMTMMQRNVRLEDRSQTRMNLDRALNYIADEIKGAQEVEIVESGSSFPGSGTGALLLTIPDPDPTTDTDDIPGTPDADPYKTVYFIRPSTDTWRGPNTINRDKRESYSNPVGAGEVDGDAVLVDGITVPDSTELAEIQDKCDDDGGTLKGANGFYACIDEDENTVELYLYGKIKDDPTVSILPLSTKVLLRASPSPSPSPT